MERRNFLKVVGAAALVSPLAGITVSSASETQHFTGYKFPELKYGFAALEPYIDAQTMELHYTKHHQGYFNKFIAAAKKSGLQNTPIEKIFAGVSKHPAGIRNNGGGFYNHSLYWENMTPSPGEIPTGLKKAITTDFGSVETFKEKFATAAKTQFGSGWAWLVAGENGKLFVSSTPNQDNPLMDVVAGKGQPLLAIDVWEHAYYLNYQNKRAAYVDNFWKIVNWETVNKRWKSAVG